jgi:hypothetical protein
MKRLMLAGTAFLGLAAAGSATNATVFDFDYTGSLVNFAIPTTGAYQILAFGAQGGNSEIRAGSFGVGGLGAEIGGDFHLTAGETLQIAVGGIGGSGSGGGGGGGGTFVVGPDNAPLVIAGAGGGGGIAGTTPLPSQGGLTGPAAEVSFLMVFSMAAPTATEAALVFHSAAVAAVAGFLVLAAILSPVAPAAVHSRLWMGACWAAASAAVGAVRAAALEGVAVTAVAVAAITVR